MNSKDYAERDVAFFEGLSENGVIPPMHMRGYQESYSPKESTVYDPESNLITLDLKKYLESSGGAYYDTYPEVASLQNLMMATNGMSETVDTILDPGHLKNITISILSRFEDIRILVALVPLNIINFRFGSADSAIGEFLRYGEIALGLCLKPTSHNSNQPVNSNKVYPSVLSSRRCEVSSKLKTNFECFIENVHAAIQFVRRNISVTSEKLVSVSRPRLFEMCNILTKDLITETNINIVTPFEKEIVTTANTFKAELFRDFNGNQLISNTVVSDSDLIKFLKVSRTMLRNCITLGLNKIAFFEGMDLEEYSSQRLKLEVGSSYSYSYINMIICREGLLLKLIYKTKGYVLECKDRNIPGSSNLISDIDELFENNKELLDAILIRSRGVFENHLTTLVLNYSTPAWINSGFKPTRSKWNTIARRIKDSETFEKYKSLVHKIFVTQIIGTPFTSKAFTGFSRGERDTYITQKKSLLHAYSCLRGVKDRSAALGDLGEYMPAPYRGQTLPLQSMCRHNPMSYRAMIRNFLGRDFSFDTFQRILNITSNSDFQKYFEILENANKEYAEHLRNLDTIQHELAPGYTLQNAATQPPPGSPQAGYGALSPYIHSGLRTPTLEFIFNNYSIFKFCLNYRIAGKSIPRQYVFTMLVAGELSLRNLDTYVPKIFIDKDYLNTKILNQSLVNDEDTSLVQREINSLYNKDLARIIKTIGEINESS